MTNLPTNFVSQEMAPISRFRMATWGARQVRQRVRWPGLKRAAPEISRADWKPLRKVGIRISGAPARGLGARTDPRRTHRLTGSSPASAA
jgi:hypothetical protein